MSNACIIKGTRGEVMSIIVSILCINKGLSRQRGNDVDHISENVPNILDEQIQTL
jgi:hypothetical protein